MMSKPYLALLSSTPGCLAEEKHSYETLTERHVQALWLEQRYFKGLKDSLGQPVKVVSPGIWNGEKGPDFLKAHLYIGEEEVWGDVEIHLHEEGWYSHRHYQDPAYNQVVLHLSFWPSRKSRQIVKENGKTCAQIYLEPFLSISSSKMIQLIDLDLYPYKKFIGSGRCADKVFNKLSEREAAEFFSSAAEWRLREKKKFLQVRFESYALQMAAGLAMALGYKHNSEAFIDLFSYLLSFQNLSEQELLAVALGSSGFFESRYEMKWNKSSFYQVLRQLWWEKRDMVLHQTIIKCHSVRPLNHPVRRLAYMVKLLADPNLERLWQNIKEAWFRSAALYEQKAISLAEWLDEILFVIPNYKDPYWNYYYTFETIAKEHSLSMIGKDTKLKVLINTFLPLLYAELQEDKREDQRFLLFTFYRHLGSTGAGKTDYLTHRFFGNSAKGKILNKALQEQGAYQLHKDFCLHFEASCEGCPFIERYLSLQ